MENTIFICCIFRTFMVLKTSRPTQDGNHFPDDIFKFIFLNENVEISINIFPNGPINNNPALAQIMAWRRPGDKPLSEPMMASLQSHMGTLLETLTIDHMLLECALLQECRDEYYAVDSLNALFETIPETCIVEFLREAGFFYLIWCNLLTSTSPQTFTIWSDLSNYLENENNSETHLLV